MRRPLSDGALVLLAGLAMGGLGAGLALWGNPANSGICISCFMENLAEWHGKGLKKEEGEKALKELCK